MKKTYYQLHRIEILAKAKARRLANPAKHRKYLKEYRKRNLEHIREVSRKYQARRQRSCKAYREMKTANAIKWREANKERFNKYHRTYSQTHKPCKKKI